jgi:hypothetical protein
LKKPKTLGTGRCVFGSSPKQLELPHPELVHWWLLVHSSPFVSILQLRVIEVLPLGGAQCYKKHLLMGQLIWLFPKKTQKTKKLF